MSDSVAGILKHQNHFLQNHLFHHRWTFHVKKFRSSFWNVWNCFNGTQRLFYWTWQCFFRYEQPWCIFSAMILVLDKYEVFRSIYSEKSILNSFHLKKDLRIEKVNFQKSFDHLSCCWLNVVPVQTDSHMVKRVWYNMKIHPFSGNLFFEIFQKFFTFIFHSDYSNHNTNITQDPHSFNQLATSQFLLELATSMLVTDVGDEMCWRPHWDVGDGFRRFFHQHSLSFNINFGHQQPKDVTNIEILSLTSKNCHQHLWSHYFVWHINMHISHI